MTDPSYPNTPLPVLADIRRIIPGLPGWTSPERCCEMADAVFETRPKICVELGVFGGRSLIAQGLALKHAGCGVIAGIDPWSVHDALEGECDANKDWWSKVDLNKVHQTCMEAIWSNGLQSHVSVIRNASQHAAALFGEIDMLMIDGNHAEEPCLRDVGTWVPKVRKGGYIFADDSDWPSTQKGYARLRELADVVAIGSEVDQDGTVKHNRYLVARKK